MHWQMWLSAFCGEQQHQHSFQVCSVKALLATGSFVIIKMHLVSHAASPKFLGSSTCSVCFHLFCAISALFYCVNATVQMRNPISTAPKGRELSTPCYWWLGAGTSFVPGESFSIKDKQPENWQSPWLFPLPGVGKGPAQCLGAHQGEGRNVGKGKTWCHPKDWHQWPAGPPCYPQ